MVTIRKILGGIWYLVEAQIDTIKATEKFVSGMVNPLTGVKFKDSEDALKQMTAVMVETITELKKAK